MGTVNLHHNTYPLKPMLTTATTFDILIPLTLHPALLSGPVGLPENVGVNKRDRIKIYIYIQGVPGEMWNTSGECSLSQTIPI